MEPAGLWSRKSHLLPLGPSPGMGIIAWSPNNVDCAAGRGKAALWDVEGKPIHELFGKELLCCCWEGLEVKHYQEK